MFPWTYPPFSQGKRRDESTREDALTIEPQAVLRNRLFSFWDDILARAAALPPGTDSTPALEILVVSHGGSIRCLVQDLLLERREDYTIDWDRLDPKGEGVEKRIGNCCVSEFQMRLVEEPVGGTRSRSNQAWCGADTSDHDYCSQDYVGKVCWSDTLMNHTSTNRVAHLRQRRTRT